MGLFLQNNFYFYEVMVAKAEAIVPGLRVDAGKVGRKYKKIDCGYWCPAFMIGGIHISVGRLFFLIYKIPFLGVRITGRETTRQRIGCIACVNEVVIEAGGIKVIKKPLKRGADKLCKNTKFP